MQRTQTFRRKRAAKELECQNCWAAGSDLKTCPYCSKKAWCKTCGTCVDPQCLSNTDMNQEIDGG